MTGLLVVAAFVGGALAVFGVVRAKDRRNTGWLGTSTGYVVGALALTALFALTALGSLGGLLGRMHVPGIADRGVDQLIGPALGVGRAFVEETTQRWATWYDQASIANPGYVARPSVVLWAYLMIDALIFVPAYVTLLSMIRWRCRWLTFDGEAPSAPWSTSGEMARRFALPIAIAVVDQTENLLAEFVIRRPLADAVGPGDDVVSLSGVGVAALQVATTLKFLLIAYFVITTIPLLIRLWGRTRSARRGLGNVLFRLRALIALAFLFGAVALLPLQVPDIYRRWGPAPTPIVLAVTAALAFGLVTWIWARRIVSAPREFGRQPTRTSLLIAALLVAAIGVTGYVARGPTGLVVLAAALFVLWLLDGTGSAEERPAGSRPTAGAIAVPKLLATAPLVMLGLGALRAIFPETILNHPDDASLALLILLLAGALPVAGALAVYETLGWEPVQSFRLHGRWHLVARMAVAVLTLYVYVRVVAAPWSFSQGVGALAVAGAFFAIAAIGFGALSLWVERVAPPKALVALGCTRTPVFAFLLIWLVISGAAPIERIEYHDVRTDLPAAAARPITLEDALAAWTARNPPAPAAPGARSPIPMVFVSANGGGIKAATWAAFALDCVLRGGDGVDDPDTRDRCETITPEGGNRTASVFAMSGVSGGGVGMAEFVANELFTDGERRDGWIREVLGDDFVSPTLAWQLFIEMPRALLQFDAGMDRAEVLERSWERGWTSPTLADRTLAAIWGSDDEIGSPLHAGLLSTRAEHSDQIPLLLLNSATVEDGCRVIVSPLKTDGTDDPSSGDATTGGRNCTAITRLQDPLPEDQLFAASRDVRHFLCAGNDVRLSSAAMMAARFPWVSPSGRLPFCQGEPASVHVVDGGYLDNSGGATIGELWEAVQGWVDERNASDAGACIVPYLLIIDSGYGPTPESKGDEVRELLVPATGAFAAMDSRTIEGRNDAALAFRRPLVGVVPTDRVAALYLRSQPGAEAPNGWTLDDTTIDALEKQLASNDLVLQEIEEWFSQTDSCG